MTKVESSANDAPTNRSQSRKERQRRDQKKDKTKAPTKVVVRHLPPTMTEEEFLKQIEMPEHDYFYFAAADWSLGNCATCRAYITLKSYDDVFTFRDRFDGYVFVDSSGAEYPAIVEFAPFQGLLKNRSRRNDNKANTIEQEAHYQQFLAKLEEERVASAKGSEVKLEYTLDRKKVEITSTPLLQYLANKKEKRREEARKRTEEKRHQREEEKERRRDKQPQITKIMNSERGNKNSDAAKGGDMKSKDSTNSKNNNESVERKSSRAKRKAERKQRRKEQRENAKTDDQQKPKEKMENKTNEAAANGEKLIKKYSEKRERERERNRNRKEKESKDKEAKPETTNKDTNSKADTATTAAVVEETTVKQKTKEEQISETVCNFIRSVANVKEFVPKHKQQQQSEGIVPAPMSEVVECKGELLSAEKTDKIENERKVTCPKPEPPRSDLTEKQKEQLQRREERRIRNKDRPSMAIYRPKPRQRLSEESDASSNAVRDVRSRSNSDCEGSKQDEAKSNKKKVSRYSERRSDRRLSAAVKKSKSSESEESTVKSGKDEEKNSNAAETEQLKPDVEEKKITTA